MEQKMLQGLNTYDINLLGEPWKMPRRVYANVLQIMEVILKF